ncbi:ATP-dependent RNA helicase DDX54 [Asbolus verrucosus]|uniref:RNA helicase n=1 Tax=Asbolus verrucosus TaxID=1661398 RepID=A0A482VDR2_ASBVE|nr:ATP-dependent RNA helicase DDX54 [Asbolus verrucosus]
MGLSFNVLKGITKRGYQQPTPIQRKAIPLVLEGRDVVAMARTGSGKTACFLIPMFEKLKMRSAKAGARALVLSPTRELALQTLKFIKEIGRFMGLKAAVILGGDSMDEQFSAIHGNPDVIVATPGRFLHVCIEMELKLNSIEYVVFDEADRLFEMGLGEQLSEIASRLPDARQTLLFSATLPKVLVEFAKAGLSDPVLIRLDVESKIPEQLQLWYITVRPEERLAALLVLLKTHIDPNQQTVVFAATKHHVEYIHMILERVNITNTYIYSNLDPSARKINAAKFSTGKVKVLVVTDVAARGIDIPQLDNVINYNFPAKSKLFVHRVGRCARAGRSGTAYSLVGPDEHAYLLDLHLFLGRPLEIVTRSAKGGSVGRLPRSLIEEQHGALLTLHENNVDLVGMRKVTENAYQQYSRSRPAASSDSNRRVKELPFNSCSKEKETKLLNDRNEPALTKSSSEDIETTFGEVILPKKRKIDDLYKKNKRQRTDRDNFIPYLPPDRHTEEGLAVNNFQNEASQVQFDLTCDSEEMMRKSAQMKKWDRKKKKMVALPDKRAGKIKTESGVWIPATYKSNRYAQWKEKTKIAAANESDGDDETPAPNRRSEANTHWAKHNKKLKLKQKKSELKTTEQILKARKIAEKKKNKQKRRAKKTKKNK